MARRSSDISLEYLVRAILYRWWLVGTATLLCVIVSLWALATSEPLYEISMRVGSANESAGGLNPGALAGLGFSSLLEGSSDDPEYARYQTALSTVALARRVAARDGIMQTVFASAWNAETETFDKVGSTTGRYFSWLYAWLGMETAVRPSPVMLRDFLETRLAHRTDTTDNSTELSMLWPAPEFGEELLLAIHEEINQLLREQARTRASAYMSYLEERLANVTTQEYRNNLLNLIMEQEQKLLLTHPGVEYAAVIIDPPTASDLPVSPSPLLYLLAGFAVGTFLGVLLAMAFTPLKPAN